MRIVLLAALLAAPVLARGDASITYDLAGGECRPEPAALHVSGARVRMDLAPFGGVEQSALYDVVEQTMVYLDHTQKTQFLMETDRDAADFQADVASATVRSVDKELEKAQAQMDEMCAQMERSGRACPQMPTLAALANMDMDQMLAQQQQMYEQMDPKTLERAGVDVDKAQADLEATRKMISGPPGEEREAGSDTIDGRTCRVFERRDGEQLTDWRCEAEPAALGIGERDARGLAAAVRDLVRYGKAFAALQERFGTKARSDVTGVVLARRCYANGRETGRATARIATGDLDESLFEIPPGYAPLMESLK